MIDLHTHTKYSDGTWNVKELLKNAENANVEILSITDHDTVSAYKEMKEFDYKKYFSGKIIKGIEFSTVYDGVFFHLLAYDFDTEKMEEFLKSNYKKPNLDKEFNYMMNSCKKNNVIIDDINYYDRSKYPVSIIWQEIKKHNENKKLFSEEEWKDEDIFFNSCVTNKDFPVALDMSIHYPKADVVTKKVRELGGKTFVAHVFKYKLKDTFDFLNKLTKDKVIDGVEVYHSYFNDEQIKKLNDYCIKNNLLMSGGTDCHGMKKPDRKIGIGYGNMNIKKEIIHNWGII